MWENSPFHFYAKFTSRRGQEITFSVYHKNHPGIQRFFEGDNQKLFDFKFSPVGKDFYILWDDRRKIYDVYLKNYDFAVPQQWAEENYFKKNLPLPAVVWSYDDKFDPQNILQLGNAVWGEPVYLETLLYHFQKDIADQYKIYAAQYDLTAVE